MKRPEHYEYSGHRAYIGLDHSGLVDTEPVLRHSGGRKKRAVEVYTRFVESCIGQQSEAKFYQAREGRMLGNDKFLKEVKHRIGEHRNVRKSVERIHFEDLLRAAERTSGLSQQELCSRSKNRRTVAVRDAVIVFGRERGIRNRELAEALGLGASAITRRAVLYRTQSTDSQDVIKLRTLLGRRGRR